VTKAKALMAAKLDTENFNFRFGSKAEDSIQGSINNASSFAFDLAMYFYPPYARLDYVQKMVSVVSDRLIDERVSGEFVSMVRALVYLLGSVE
jgi:hypothetical protein